jgi:hypothetical protein
MLSVWQHGLAHGLSALLPVPANTDLGHRERGCVVRRSSFNVRIQSGEMAINRDIRAWQQRFLLGHWPPLSWLRSDRSYPAPKRSLSKPIVLQNALLFLDGECIELAEQRQQTDATTDPSASCSFSDAGNDAEAESARSSRCDER